MANFPALKMTAAGRVLQAKAQTGQELKFSRVGLGDGTLAGSLDALPALVAEKKSLSIRDHKATGDGTSILQVIATNEGLASGFYIREVGLFALDPDTGEELLYSYTNAGAESDFLPGAGGAITYEGLFDLITVVGNADNVTAVIDDYITIALKSEVEALRPYILPTGGTVGQMARKKSNAEGDVEWFDPELSGLDVRLKSIEEPRSAVANQRTFTLQKTVTSGLAVYVAGRRISREAWTPLSAMQLKMNDPLDAGTAVLFVNNEEAGPGESLSVSIEGPTLVYPGSTNTFTIGAFDSFSVYAQAASKGTLTRSGKTLTLVIASGEAAGTLDLDVTRDNVKVTRRIAIGAAAIAKPQILTPAPGSTGVGFEPDLTIAPFVVYPAGYDTLRKTRWQVALDAAFTQMVYNAESTTNLTAINLGSVGVRLDPSRRYYARAQFSGDTLTSVMSDAVSFNTASVYIRRPAITAPIDGQVEVSAAAGFVSDAFSVYGGTDTQSGSRWQVSTVSDFSTTLYDSGWIAATTGYKPPASLAQKTEYYIRVKYRGAAIGESEWSASVRFVTADQLKGEYTQLPAGATTRSAAVVVSYADKIYVFGGTNGSSLLSDFWSYDLVNRVWTQEASGPRALCNCAHAVIGDVLYVVGGYAGNPSYGSASVYTYNFKTRAWASIANYPLAINQAKAAAVGGKLYVYGGLPDIGGVGTGTFYCYDPVAKTWTLLTGNPSCYGHSMCAYDGKIYIAGGFGSQSEGWKKTLHCYDVARNVWTQKASIPFPDNKGRVGGTLSEIAGKLYWFGGGYYVDTYNADLYVYDIAINGWLNIPAVGSVGMSGRQNHGAAVIGGMLYIYGGATYSYARNDLWQIA